MSVFLTLDSVSAATPDRQRLFDNLTFSVGAERVGLVGCNGAGKSTLLRIIAGSAEPAANGCASGLPAHCPACTRRGFCCLEEPTNHLDIESIEVLEQALLDFDGALLVVSHDAVFLKAIGIGREVGVG